MNALLEVRDLHVDYGRVEALHGVSLTVPRGAIVTVVGPNGAGKTTLLNAIIGLLPSRGKVVYKGADVGRQTVETRVADGLCLVPEKRELFTQMTVADNLDLGGYARRRQGRAARQKMVEAMEARFPRLRERRGQRAGTLSGGERQMLAIARALMAKPDLLMLDEPSLGLAPLVVRDVLAIVKALRDDGVSILIIEQNARAALQIADYGYVLETGAIALEGPAAALESDPRVIETYLGLAGHAVEPLQTAVEADENLHVDQ